jgi:hypothetical protein
LKLVANLNPVGQLTLSVINHLLKPALLAPHQDSTPVVIKVFQESATGLPFGITDAGDVRPLMLVKEPPLLNLGGRVRIGAGPKELSAVRRQLALEAPPLVGDRLLKLTHESRRVNGSSNGHKQLPANAAERVLVASHD